jgi:hypothetical protein
MCHWWRMESSPRFSKNRRPAGCPISRPFLARCGIPQILTVHLLRRPETRDVRKLTAEEPRNSTVEESDQEPLSWPCRELPYRRCPRKPHCPRRTHHPQRARRRSIHQPLIGRRGAGTGRRRGVGSGGRPTAGTRGGGLTRLSRSGGLYALEARTSQGADADAARVRGLAAYSDFLALWKGADPDMPILKQAKAEYAKLQ